MSSWLRSGGLAETISKVHIHKKKLKLSVWWNYVGNVYLEFLPRGEIISSSIYCQKLIEMKDDI